MMNKFQRILVLLAIVGVSFLATVPNAQAIPTTAVVNYATGAIFKVTIDSATLVLGYVDSATLAISAKRTTTYDLEGITAILINNTSPTVDAPGTLTYPQEGAYYTATELAGLQRVRAVLMGMPTTQSPATHAVPIGVVDRIKTPFVFDIRAYASVFLRFYFQGNTGVRGASYWVGCQYLAEN